MIVHYALTLLVISKPKAFVLIIVSKIKHTPAMLMVLKPITLILLSIRKCINTISLTLAFHVMAFVGITVKECRFALPVRFSTYKFTKILRLILESVISDYNLLSPGGDNK
jgi:hypothetical protein